MPKRKPFNKKNSVTFKLVHRSQHDPLAADASAPQFVLQECKSARSREEQARYGVYYDDDYDYMQHLMSVDELDGPEERDLLPVRAKQAPDAKAAAKLMLPSSLFESQVQQATAMLATDAGLRGPRPDWDPDIVAALDDDFDYDDPSNLLEDDFVLQANARAPCDPSEGEKGNSSREDEERKERESCSGFRAQDSDEGDEDEAEGEESEKQSCFTSYSMTSSVMRRNAGLSLLDQQFETLFESEYGDETEIGALDVHEIEGQDDPNHSQSMKSLIRGRKGETEERFDAKALIDERLHYELPDEAGDEAVVEMQVDDKRDREDRFDCESILSTYSSLYNHPKLICEAKSGSRSADRRVRVNPTTGVPVDSSNAGLTPSGLKRLDGATRGSGTGATLPARRGDETQEEKKARKALVKDQRRERRMERKANRESFRQEDQRLSKECMNVRTQLSVMRLA